MGDGYCDDVVSERCTATTSFFVAVEWASACAESLRNAALYFGVCARSRFWQRGWRQKGIRVSLLLVWWLLLLLQLLLLPLWGCFRDCLLLLALLLMIHPRPLAVEPNAPWKTPLP